MPTACNTTYQYLAWPSSKEKVVCSDQKIASAAAKSLEYQAGSFL
jgi:hypothetical protein